MKTLSLAFALLTCVTISSCGSSKPENPVIKIDYNTTTNSGTENYTTSEEYYIDNDGKKVKHGYSRSFYILGGGLAREDYYEHGEQFWWKEYDKFGKEKDSRTLKK